MYLDFYYFTSVLIILPIKYDAMKLEVTTDLLTSISVLSQIEQKRTNETLCSVAKQSTSSGLRLHKIEHPSNHIFSYSVSKDLRIITYIDGERKTFLYAGHHDEAYNWIAKRRFISLNDGTFSIIKTNEEFIKVDDALITELHKAKDIKRELIDELKKIDNDDVAIEFILDQPSELQEELLDFIASKSKTHTMMPSHFIKVINDDSELQKALEYPLELWRTFLHPKQKRIVEKDINQSVFITGAPGTGKTVCLIHRIKQLEQQLNDNECLILTTFKQGLKDYLNRMLRIIGYDETKTFIDDISQLKVHEGFMKAEAKINGLFHIENSKLYYYHRGEKLIVRHLLFDEYQDFRKSQINGIKLLIEYVPFTLSFDYLQTIYRNNRNLIEDLEAKKNVELIKLDYSYRINSKILNRLKYIVRLIRVLSNESLRLGDLGYQVLDEELIENTQAAIIGPAIITESFENENQLEEKISGEYAKLKQTYATDEIVITAFFYDLFKNLSESESFHINEFPKVIRSSYKYIPTLKGKEYKAGVVILDDTICQMLNINRSIFLGNVTTGFMGGGDNYRLNLNLLFVVLSRFRDYIKVYYPSKYEIIVKPILG